MEVSDPLLGGTYMTLLNTISNMGGLWPNPVSLKLIDLTSCLDAALCSSTRDGFYLVGLGSVVLGASFLRSLLPWLHSAFKL